jgi:hypothetical protein
MDAKEAEVDGRRPRRSEHPAPEAIDAWRARYATQPWKTRHRQEAPSTSARNGYDPRWQASPRTQTWQGYRPSSEVLSNTSEQWFPPGAFAEPADGVSQSGRPAPAIHARHRATRRAERQERVERERVERPDRVERQEPSRRGAGRWARQLVVLLPLALASSSWATLGDAEAPDGGWFPKNYRMALGAETTDATTTVEDSTASVAARSTSKPTDRSQADDRGARADRSDRSDRAERSLADDSDRVQAPVADPEPVETTEPEAPAEPAPEPQPSRTAAPQPTPTPEPSAPAPPPEEEEPDGGGGLLPPLPILGDLPLVGGLTGQLTGAAPAAGVAAPSLLTSVLFGPPAG